jgi:hypothetical protein
MGESSFRINEGGEFFDDSSSADPDDGDFYYAAGRWTHPRRFHVHYGEIQIVHGPSPKRFLFNQTGDGK